MVQQLLVLSLDSQGLGPSILYQCHGTLRRDTSLDSFNGILPPPKECPIGLSMLVESLFRSGGDCVVNVSTGILDSPQICK